MVTKSIQDDDWNELPLWPSGQSTWTGSTNLSPGAFAYQRIISNNSYERDEQGDNPVQEKDGSTVSSINCDLCSHLD